MFYEKNGQQQSATVMNYDSNIENIFVSTNINSQLKLYNMYSSDFNFFLENQIFTSKDSVNIEFCSRLESRLFRIVPLRNKALTDYEIKQICKEIHMDLMYKEFRLPEFITGNKAKEFYFEAFNKNRNFGSHVRGYFKFYEDKGDIGNWIAFECYNSDFFAQTFNSSMQAMRYALGMSAINEYGEEV